MLYKIQIRLLYRRVYTNIHTERRSGFRVAKNNAKITLKTVFYNPENRDHPVYASVFSSSYCYVITTINILCT